MNFYQRDFLTLLDYDKDEIEALIDLGIKFKRLKQSNIAHRILKGKNIVVISNNIPGIVRCAFDVVTYDLGMNISYLEQNTINKMENISDDNKILSLMYDGIAYYGFNDDVMTSFFKQSRVPVWNGMSSYYNPIQVLADLVTIKDHFGTLRNKKLVFCGNGKSNISNSLMIACSKLGIDFVCCAPKELWPDDEIFNKCREFSEANDSKIVFLEDIIDAVYNADIVYTSAWVNLNDEDIIEDRIKLLSSYQINKQVMSNAKNNAIFLHNLPAFYDNEAVFAHNVYEKYGISELEVTKEVIEDNNSKVYVQAENYLHAVKAVICSTLYKGVIK